MPCAVVFFGAVVFFSVVLVCAVVLIGVSCAEVQCASFRSFSFVCSSCKVVTVTYVPTFDIQTTCEGAAPLEHMGLNLRLLYTCGDYKLDFDSKCALDVHSMDLEHGEVFTVCGWGGNLTALASQKRPMRPSRHGVLKSFVEMV